ncbi:hypothetical protein [Paraburkholderia dinghuensis]|uniref:SH3 domain-containing protein n=1 Tax=Paraburkholderia dinghuensis TaxID=2305225 RepID=A0A3N6NLM3_9BURK|nr:hypothetical protein [Paraburkholderia dinghuensis]RQH09897.1 hypothetical protein D1Y85_01790 [Paraburkholderia dinghuensis]
MLTGATFSTSAKNNTLSVDSAGSIKFCRNKSDCEIVTPTGELKSAIDDGYENLSIVEIYKNGNQEIAATSAGGCSRFFSFDQAIHVFSALNVGAGKDICNYKIDGKYLTSAYKLDSKQHEDVYELKNGTYHLVLSDVCVGCDQVSRSIYRDGQLSEKLLVTSEIKYTQRQPVTSLVATDKAWLFAEASNASRTEMYLVKGDKVQLLEFNDADGLWYFVRYLSKKNGPILKWVKCESLAICK